MLNAAVVELITILLVITTYILSGVFIIKLLHLLFTDSKKEDRAKYLSALIFFSVLACYFTSAMEVMVGK